LLLPSPAGRHFKSPLSVSNFAVTTEQVNSWMSKEYIDSQLSRGVIYLIIPSQSSTRQSTEDSQLKNITQSSANFKMLSSILTLVLATAAFAMPANIEARVAPDPSQVYINNIVYGGSGCPQGSVGSYISGDRQT
jgi:hypothetical protein